MATGVDAKLLKSTKFPPEFNQKVDMQKVNLQVMKKWIASRISQILGDDDDVVIELCFNLIEGPRYPDIKSLQIQLAGFLEKETAPFCKELWKLCLSAQSSPQGVPKELLEAKKLELIQEKIEADKAAEEARKRRDNMVHYGGDFGRRGHAPRGSDNWRGRRKDRDHDGGESGRDFDISRPSEGDLRARGSYRGGHRDSYVPGGDRRGRGRRIAAPQRRRSPSVSRSRSMSRRSYSPRNSMSRSPGPRRSRRLSMSPPPRSRKTTDRKNRKRSRSPLPSHRLSPYHSRHSHGRRDSSRSSAESSRSPPPKRQRYFDRRSPPTARGHLNRSTHSHSRYSSRSLSPSRSRSASSPPASATPSRRRPTGGRSRTESRDSYHYGNRRVSGRDRNQDRSRSSSPAFRRRTHSPSDHSSDIEHGSR